MACRSLALDPLNLELPNNLAEVRDFLLRRVQQAKLGVSVTTEQQVFEHIESVLENSALAGGRHAFLLHRCYRELFGHKDVAPEFDSLRARAHLPTAVIEHIRLLLGQISIDAGRADTALPRLPGFPVNKGVLYFLDTEREGWFFIHRTAVYDGAIHAFLPSADHLYMAQWTNPHVKAISASLPGSSLLLVPALCNGVMLGALAVCSRRDVFDPLIHLPWILELGISAGSLLEDLHIFGKTNPEKLRSRCCSSTF